MNFSFTRRLLAAASLSLWLLLGWTIGTFAAGSKPRTEVGSDPHAQVLEELPKPSESGWRVAGHGDQ